MIKQQRRDWLQATFTPRARGGPPKKYLRAWEKLAFVRRIQADGEEIAAVRSELGKSMPSALQAALGAIESASERTANPSAAASALAHIDADALADVADRIVRVRARELRSLVAEQERDAAAESAVAAASTVSAARAKRLVGKLGVNPATATVAAVAEAATAHVESKSGLGEGFKMSLQVEPAGYLHLERLTFTPAGIERGELVHSIPLAPGEEVNVLHREWSDTSEEFQKIVTDYHEDVSEQGVAEKSEVVQAVASQSMHSSGFNTGITASGGYGPVSVTATAGYAASDASLQSQQFSRDSSIDLTRKASSRTKKEHKISFKLASSSGTEDSTVRRIKNPSDQPVRVDYFQLLRKWQVDLYRYGIRLTYDLTVPEPGADILSKVREAREIETALQYGFAAEDAPAGTPDWARFGIVPAGITRTNHASLAAEHGAAIPPPPAKSIYFETVGRREWQAEDMAKNTEVTAFEVIVPEDYEVTDCVFWGASGTFKKDEAIFNWKEHNKKSVIIGRSGRFQLLVESRYLTSFALRVRITAVLRPEVLEAWQLKVWSVLRDAAQARYYERRQGLKERLSTLSEELGAQDPLSLRKIEREEVMKSVLAWLFGPDFAFVPKGLPSKL